MKAILLVSLIIILFFVAVFTLPLGIRFDTLSKQITSAFTESVKDSIGKKEAVGLFLIADGTFSRNRRYNIPELSIPIVLEIIDSSRLKKQPVELFISYVDDNSKNNENYHLTIPSYFTIVRPVRMQGETFYDFKIRENSFELEKEKLINDSIKYESAFSTRKEKFISDVGSLLKNKVYTNSKKNRYSDIITKVNSALYTFENMKLKKAFIVGFSDFENDTPDILPAVKLKEIPANIGLISINPTAGSSRLISEKVLVLPHPDLLIDLVMN